MDIPRNIKDLLKTEKLCAMATCQEDHPYLSLMNFTFDEEENIVILSSRRDSKKFKNIQNNKNVSLLLFSKTHELSATFLGSAVTLERGEEQRYRALHLQRNNMPQFVLGDDIGIIVFRIEKIIVSDNQDQLTTHER